MEEFFTRQFDTWLQLSCALGEQFSVNKHVLEQDPVAAANLIEQLRAIHEDAQPYGKLRNVGTLVEQLAAINQRLIEQKRAFSLTGYRTDPAGDPTSRSVSCRLSCKIKYAPFVVVYRA